MSSADMRASKKLQTNRFDYTEMADLYGPGSELEAWYNAAYRTADRHGSRWILSA